MEVCSDRTFWFAADPPELWSALTAVERYRGWWPWLRELEAGPGWFCEGARWRCVVRSPLLYRVKFDVVLEEVVSGRSVAAVVAGDIAGRARLDVTPVEGGSQLRLVSALTSESVLLGTIARLAPRSARLGHDRLVDAGLRQFQAGAFDR